MEIKVLENLSQEDFVENYISKNQPCLVKDKSYKADHWDINFIEQRVGDLTTQIYGALFSLENIDTLANYINEYFGRNAQLGDQVPYVRWYNRLKDIEFPWGDEALNRLSSLWHLPTCIPDSNLLVPVTNNYEKYTPVMNVFPYRGLLVAAKGARTRLHRDPFCSDAVVNQFVGVKEFMLFRPDRTEELKELNDHNSFGGFRDIRLNQNNDIKPDYTGCLCPGEFLYIPHGWLHDVVVAKDSISITWNFVHKSGAKEYLNYLQNDPEKDSEFEVLKYFYNLAGYDVSSGQEVLEVHNIECA